MPTNITEHEITTLAARYGAPRRVTTMLSGAPFNPISSTDRVGEVCMVIRRPNGRLLTAIKTFYPPGGFRLLTGGVAHGEAIEDALWREVAEETSLTVAIRRFLAVIEYHLDIPVPELRSYTFATYAFLLDELSGVLAVQDPDERLGSFREIEVAELPQLATILDHVAAGYDPEIQGDWSDWGRFRAIVHRVVFETMNDEQ